MRISRSRLIAVAAVMLAVAGGVVAAGSLASGRAPAAVHRAAALAQRTFVSAASGNDANPCTRTAPCRNFQAAIAQTASGGEVVVLDSGGYGMVTINQAVSLVAPPGVYAGISVFSGTGFSAAGITITAGASDVVTIRGLTLNGLGGDFGIVFNSGAALYVQDTVFKNLSEEGVFAGTSASANVVVEDSLFSRSGFGVGLDASAGTIRGTIEHCRFEDGDGGVAAGPNSVAVIRDSVASGNGGAGFEASSPGSQLDVENSLTTHNGYGLRSFTGNVRVSETTIEENTTGVAEFIGGTITSFGNNRLAGNTTNGSFSSTIALQ